ncbi:MAG: hypothetical protein ACRCXT_05545, partial [Paraclostridium sp.]
LFNEFDYRKLENRELNEDIDELIDKIILKSHESIKKMKLHLIIYMPMCVRNYKNNTMSMPRW